MSNDITIYGEIIEVSDVIYRHDIRSSCYESRVHILSYLKNALQTIKCDPTKIVGFIGNENSRTVQIFIDGGILIYLSLECRNCFNMMSDLLRDTIDKRPKYTKCSIRSGSWKSWISF